MNHRHFACLQNWTVEILFTVYTYILLDADTFRRSRSISFTNDNMFSPRPDGDTKGSDPSFLVGKPLGEKAIPKFAAQGPV